MVLTKVRVNAPIRAQGTIEYLVILAIVVVISLVVVGLVMQQVGSSSNVSSTASEISSKSSLISITDASFNSVDGNYFLGIRNNDPDVTIINSVSVGNDTNSFFEQLPLSAEKVFKIPTTGTCVNGQKTSADIIITYTTKYGLIKTQKLSGLSFACETVNVDPSKLAGYTPQAPVVVGEPAGISGLVAHFKMNDDNNPTAVLDSSGNNFVGVAQQNTNLLTTSKVNKALSFNGTDDYISISDTGTNWSTPKSISLWLKINGDYTDDRGTIFEKTGIAYITYTGVSNARVIETYHAGTSPEGYDSSTATLLDNTWYHVAYVLDAGNNEMKVYLNGDLDSTTSVTGTVGTNTSPIYSGRASLVYRFAPISLDDLRIYDQALDQNEILAIYNSGSGTESESGSLNTNLVAHYLMNDDAGDKVVVDSKGTNDGTSVRDTNEMTSSKIGKALSFNGSTDYIATPDNSSLSLYQNSFSICGWVKTGAGGSEYQSMVMVRNSAGSDDSILGGFLMYPDGRIRWDTQDYGDHSVFSINPVNDSAWHYVCGTYAETNHLTKLYVDGVYQGEQTATRFTDASDKQVTFGWNGWGQVFSGSIDDVRIYDRNLSSTEIAALYNSGSGTESESGSLGTGLVAHYTMNDDVNPTAVLDSSGNNLAGAAQQNTNVLTTSKIGKALSFNGSSDYVTSSAIPGTYTEFSISLWFKSTLGSEGSDWQQPLIHWGAASSPRIYLRFESGSRIYLDALPDSSGKVYWDGKEIGGAFPGGVDGDGIIPAFNAGTWHHVVITGNAPESFTDEVLLIGTGNPTHSGTYWEGEIDDVRIYSRDLNSSEILALYNSGSGTESEVGSLGTNLIAHYLMNDDSNTTAIVVDSKGTNDGTVQQNTNLLTTSKVNKALSFDGSSGGISIPHTTELDFGTGEFSFFGWVKINEIDSRPALFSLLNGSFAGNMQVDYDSVIDGKLSFYDGSDWLTTPTDYPVKVNDGNWHFVGLTRTGSNYTFYIDSNSFLVSGSNTGDMSGDWYFGSYYNFTYTLNGFMDDVRFYSRALTSNEAIQLYNLGHGTETI
ncbi:MAG: LamG domain-containing protein [archaeon]|jgi:hypothetical protein